jgi:hypothetical protein
LGLAFVEVLKTVGRYGSIVVLFAAASAALGVLPAAVGALLGWVTCLVGGFEVDVVEDVSDPSSVLVVVVSP